MGVELLDPLLKCRAVENYVVFAPKDQHWAMKSGALLFGHQLHWPRIDAHLHQHQAEELDQSRIVVISKESIHDFEEKALLASHPVQDLSYNEVAKQFERRHGNDPARDKEHGALDAFRCYGNQSSETESTVGKADEMGGFDLEFGEGLIEPVPEVIAPRVYPSFSAKPSMTWEVGTEDVVPTNQSAK